MTFEKIYSLLGQFFCDTMNSQQFLKISLGGHSHENRRTVVGSCLALSLTIPFTASASAASQSEHANAPHVSPVANPLESKLSQTADQT